MRVAAIERRFIRKEGSPRIFRHDIYQYVAEHEPVAWALCGTPEQRSTATQNPKELPSGSRPNSAIVAAWSDALQIALGVRLVNVRGSKNHLDKPNGEWTTSLAFK